MLVTVAEPRVHISRGAARLLLVAACCAAGVVVVGLSGDTKRQLLDWFVDAVEAAFAKLWYEALMLWSGYQTEAQYCATKAGSETFWTATADAQSMCRHIVAQEFHAKMVAVAYVLLLVAVFKWSSALKELCLAACRRGTPPQGLTPLVNAVAVRLHHIAAATDAVGVHATSHSDDVLALQHYRPPAGLSPVSTPYNLRSRSTVRSPAGVLVAPGVRRRSARNRSPARGLIPASRAL